MGVSPALCLFYEIDVGGDGSFETGGTITLMNGAGPETIDFYINGFNCTATGCQGCGPDDSLFGSVTYIKLDETQLTVNSCVAFDANNGGPFDPFFSQCIQEEPGIYKLDAGQFNFVNVIDNKQKLGTMSISSTSDNISELVFADDLTAYSSPAYDDGSLADCNLNNQHPEDGTVEIDQGLIPNTTSTTSTESSSTTSSLPTTTINGSSSTTTSSEPTTTSTEPGPCVLESLYGDSAEQTVRARYFRDEVLSVSSEGQQIIMLYYLWSPVIVAAMERDQQLREDIRGMLDQFIALMSDVP
jgi:hypothetical protein